VDGSQAGDSARNGPVGKDALQRKPCKVVLGSAAAVQDGKFVFAVRIEKASAHKGLDGYQTNIVPSDGLEDALGGIGLKTCVYLLDVIVGGWLALFFGLGGTWEAHDLDLGKILNNVLKPGPTVRRYA